MDRREAMLRELNLYPQWKLRDQPAPKTGDPLSAEANVELTPQVVVEQPVAVMPEVDTIVLTSAALEVSPGSMHGEQPSVPSSLVEGLNWSDLKQQVHVCTACRLRAGCSQTVFGVGDEKADWLFVGEGPGADEDALGEPFVGQAGKLLDNMLMAIKLKRGKNVYIANIVKCRPPGNRTPAADEIAQCLPYLERQIALMQPKLIVALGKVASNALLGKEATIASLRGKLHDYHGIPLIVTYHPAYLLRSPTEKVKAWQDLCMAVRARHGEA
jgi:uracil-DNA glycosylase